MRVPFRPDHKKHPKKLSKTRGIQIRNSNIITELVLQKIRQENKKRSLCTTSLSTMQDCSLTVGPTLVLSTFNRIRFVNKIIFWLLALPKKEV